MWVKMSSAMGSQHSANALCKSSSTAAFPRTVRVEQAFMSFASRLRACSSVLVNSEHPRVALRVALCNSSPSPSSPMRAFTLIIPNACFVASTSGDGECVATGGGKVARSCPSDDSWSPRHPDLGRRSLACPRSPLPAYAVVPALAWQFVPIDFAPGVPVHPYLNPGRKLPKLSRTVIPAPTSAPHPTTITSNTGQDVLVSDFEPVTKHYEVRRRVTRDRTE
jgi:hypothetical protein